MNTEELRKGNLIDYNGLPTYIDEVDIVTCSRFPQYFKPMKLSSAILGDFGFRIVDGVKVAKVFKKPLGRERFLMVSDAGTTNEMIYISEQPEKAEKENDLIVISNYDHDGYFYAHLLQNLFHSITREDLK